LANTSGYIWRTHAVAFVGTTGSAASEDMAMRTVLTYEINTMNEPDGGQVAGEQRIVSGQQIWLRGGDAISSSSVPGFPLTWNDDFDKLKADKTRAGARLMTLTSTPASAFYTASTWRWVTWEVNVPTYFDIILGADAGATANDAVTQNRILQYGPSQYAYQRAGWTSFKEQYRMFPGKHRYMVTNRPDNLIRYNADPPGKGAVNFSGTWSYRPAMTGAGDVTYTAPTP